MAYVRILIVGPLTEGSGNYSTAHRIRSYFEKSGSRCYFRNVSDFDDTDDFRCFLSANKIHCILAIHAFKCRTVLKDCPLPFAVIFGGTDLNENTKVDADREVIITVAKSARFLVVFSKTMYEKVAMIMPDYDQQRIWTILQAVKTYPGNYNWRREHEIEDDAVVFTLVAGIRWVKDPLFLVRSFSDWRKHNGRRKAYLVIVGPEHEKGFLKTFWETIENLSGILYLGALSISQTHRVIADSFALVNSSISEGMSSAILEAMELGVPVIARNIPGNASVIVHRHSGLLYNQPAEFLEMAELLMKDPDLRNVLVSNAYKQIREHHGWEVERNRYFELVKQLAG